MIVQRVVMPVTEAESWTVLGDDLAPVGPVENYLAYLTAIERSPNTVRAYAQSLKLWFEFLAARGVGWDRAEVDDVARFVSWLRAPAANVIVLDASASRRSATTVNRHLAGLFGFYDYQSRCGHEFAERLVEWRRVGRGSYKPFLHHVTKGRLVPTRPVKLAVDKAIPRTLTDEQIAAILRACTHLRDQFLLALLAETGVRIGQALGLRHSDFVSRDRQVRIVPRADNANGARAKVRRTHVGADHDRAGAVVLGVHARRVRDVGLRLCVREPVGRTDRAAVELSGGRRSRRPPAGPDRDLLHSPHAQTFTRHRPDPPGCPDRGRVSPADARVGHNDERDLRAPPSR